MDSGKIKAFVIGPIGDRDAEDGSAAKKSYEDAIETFEGIIEPACRAMDLDPFRADHISRSGDIHDQIYRNLRDAHVVIADLTGANPNVMYELGLRHTTGKLTFQIGERDRLPFDISTIRTILFKRTEAGFVSAKRSLIAAIAEGLQQGADPVASTRIWFEMADSEDDEKQGSYNFAFSPLEIEDEEPGFLEKLADTESGINEITSTLERGAVIFTEIAEVLGEGVKKINEIPQSGNYSSVKLTIANTTAQKLEGPAIRLKIVAKDFQSHFDRASPGMEYLLTELLKNPSQAKESTEFLKSISGLVDAAEESTNFSIEFIRELDNSGNATRLMTKVNKSIKQSITSISITSKSIASWKSIIQKIADSKDV